MQTNDRRGLIHLVYSSARESDEICNSELQRPDQAWGQLELFTSEKPNAMIFTQPDRLGFEGIVQLVAMGHARRIFDLREMPFISFSNETRESFLRVLTKSRVEYFNIFKLRHKLGEKDGDAEHIEENGLSFEQSEIKRVLKPMIETGPTVVFSDSAPDEDKAVKRLLELLSQAEIPYSPVYADNGN